ncbi:YeeE/YedE thiosulfate transporter family protein [Photobacterium sanguinicancri]|uniref:YeeE/YedE thiosulfate transporter family protein n=1 Tax=Photobacterium sanguinicancri TaxID=875932 RepID=UPI003D13BE71
MWASIISVFLALAVGYLAQRTGLCMVRGTHELWAKRPAFLLTILLCGFWFWLILPSNMPLPDTFSHQRYSVTSAFLFGGFCFGLGASLNGGCSVSTISKLARGHYHMVATIMGWIIGWCGLSSIPLTLSYSAIPAIESPSLTVVIMLFVLISLILFVIPTERRAILIGIVFFGILASVLTLLMPEWSPSQLLKDITAASIHNQPERWPDLLRYIVIIFLIVGMALGAKKRLSLAEFTLRPMQLLKHLFAGCIMGVGASLALGGNDSQLLLALPSFSPAGAMSIAMMVVGISCGIGLKRWFNKLNHGLK